LPPFSFIKIAERMSISAISKLRARQNKPIFSERQLINISLMKKPQFCAVQGISYANIQDNMSVHKADAPVICEDKASCGHCCSQ